MILEVPTFDTYAKINSKLTQKWDTPILFKQCSFGDCTTKWTLEYLIEQLGDQNVVIHESSSEHLNFLEKNFNYRTCKFSEFAKRLFQSKTVESPDNVYLRSTSSGTRSRRSARIEDDFPMLAKDLKPPRWVPFGQDNELYHSSVLRIASDQVQVWTHFDLYDNVLCQVVGSKRVVLFPPDDSKNLYVEGDKSKVNCLDNLQECFEKFPLVKRAHLHMVTLDPGNCLFIPALWWHNIKSVRSERDEAAAASHYTIGFNIFWRDQELASKSLYADKDVYGNKNLVPFDAALNNIDRAVQHLDKLPEKYRKFYKLMLVQHIQKKLNLDSM